MEQMVILFNPRPDPHALFKAGTQDYRLYDRLLHGPITSRQIVEELNILNYTGRLSDVRAALRPYLITLEARRVEGSLYDYRLKDGNEEMAA